MPEPFRFYTEASLPLYTAWRADSLRSLLHCLEHVSGSSIFYHFFHALRRRHFTTFEYKNDIARWVALNFHEPSLAERLAAIDPLEFGSVRATRNRLIECLKQALGQTESAVRVREGEELRFVTLKSFVYPVGLESHNPCELAGDIERAGMGSLFFHFIEARLRMGRAVNDFSLWLQGEFQEEQLAGQINRLSPYVYSFPDLRRKIVELLRQRCGNG
jgi:hypothetical protein